MHIRWFAVLLLYVVEDRVPNLNAIVEYAVTKSAIVMVSGDPHGVKPLKREEGQEEVHYHVTFLIFPCNIPKSIVIVPRTVLYN